MAELKLRLCCKCKVSHNRNAKYCAPCHATNMRAWRKTHPLTSEQRKKDNCRSYSYVLLKRGKIERQPCQKCGSQDSQMHHPDYDQPRLVEWMCRACHLEHHKP